MILSEPLSQLVVSTIAPDGAFVVVTVLVSSFPRSNSYSAYAVCKAREAAAKRLIIFILNIKGNLPNLN
jgi:hypothetical protein